MRALVSFTPKVVLTLENILKVLTEMDVDLLLSRIVQGPSTCEKRCFHIRRVLDLVANEVADTVLLCYTRGINQGTHYERLGSKTYIPLCFPTGKTPPPC